METKTELCHFCNKRSPDADPPVKKMYKIYKDNASEWVIIQDTVVTVNSPRVS